MDAPTVITLGEALLRLMPPQQQRFGQAESLELHVGGSEANTAVGLVRLGLAVRYLTRLPDQPLGRRIEQTLRGLGVETGFITWASEGRVGLYFVEEGLPPRPGQVIYDRAGSAAAAMQPSDLPLTAFDLPQAWLHLTGITLALSEGAHATCAAALGLAQERWPGRFSFDVNYRARLWTTDAARQACQPFMEQAALIFIAERDARQLYGLAGAADQVIEQLGARFPQAQVIMTRGAEGALAWQQGQILAQAAFPASERGRLGRGDAFGAGVLAAHLGGESLAEAIRWGAACAALKSSTPGDLALLDMGELRALLAQRGGGILR
jgi:2-dehydro-3-deoxygluconokinase